VKDQISMADLSFRAQHVIKTEIDVIRAQLSRNVLNPYRRGQLYRPDAHPCGEHQESVGLRGDHVIIGTGTKPAESPLVPFNNRNIINSDEILRMPEIPKTLIVVARR